MLVKAFYESLLLVGCLPVVQAASQSYTFNTVKTNGVGSVSALLAPPVGPVLLSGSSPNGGYTHSSLTSAPTVSFGNPDWNNTIDFDYGGDDPNIIVRLGYTTLSPPLAKQVSLSFDSGATWADHPNSYENNWQQGKIAISADGQTVLWVWSSGACFASYQQNYFGLSYGCPGAPIASDKKNATIFYSANGNKLYLSTYRGIIFEATPGTLGSSATAVKIAVHPKVTGDLWVSTDTGLYHTTDSGTTFTAVSGLTQAWSIALGAPAKAGGYPSVFASATYKGVDGIFRSDDQGASWVQIKDAAHNFGAISSIILTADLRTYGRVYIGANGKILYGDIA